MTTFLKRFVILVTLTFLLSACATTIATHGDLPDAAPPKLDCPIKKPITIRVYAQGNWSEEKEKSTVLSRYPTLEKDIIDAYKETGCFTEIKIVNLTADQVVFTNHSDLAREPLLDAKTYLDGIRKPAPADIEYYFFQESHGYGAPHFALNMIHVFTLGLIPIWPGEEVTLRSTTFDASGKALIDNESKSSAHLWTWSPFIFLSKSKKYHKAYSESKFYKNTVNDIITKTMNIIPSKP